MNTTDIHTAFEQIWQDMQKDLLQPILDNETAPTRGMVLGQLLMNELGNSDKDCNLVDNGVLSKGHKHLALDVAETMGPDWAQALYHFAVLVTKMA